MHTSSVCAGVSVCVQAVCTQVCPCTCVSVYMGVCVCMGVPVYTCACASVCVWGGPQGWTGVETRQAFWAEVGTFYGPLSVKVGPGSLPSPTIHGSILRAGKLRLPRPSRLLRGSWAGCPRQAGLGPAWKRGMAVEVSLPGQNTSTPGALGRKRGSSPTSFPSSTMLPPASVPSRPSPSHKAPLQAPDSPPGALVFQAVVPSAAPLCISVTSVPVALGTSAVQV